MEKFTLAADMLGFTDGEKKKYGPFRRNSLTREESVSSLEVTFKTQTEKSKNGQDSYERFPGRLSPVGRKEMVSSSCSCFP